MTTHCPSGNQTRGIRRTLARCGGGNGKRATTRPAQSETAHTARITAQKPMNASPTPRWILYRENEDGGREFYNHAWPHWSPNLWKASFWEKEDTVAFYAKIYECKSAQLSVSADYSIQAKRNKR